MPIWWESLSDQGMKSKVYPWVIVHAKYQTFDILPHSLNYHGGSLLWDSFGVCRSCPESPFCRRVPIGPKVGPNVAEVVVFTMAVHFVCGILIDVL